MKYHFLLLLLLLVGCQETTTQNNTDNSEEEKYNFQLSAEQIAVLNKQLSKGISGEIYDTDIETYTYSKSDLDATIPLLREILAKEGYQQPSETEFIAKVQRIFGRTIDPEKSTDYLFLNNWQPCDRQIHYYRKNTNEVYFYSYYIVKKERFFTELFALPELINYQKLCPECLQKEQNVPKKIQIEGESAELYKWCEDEDLAEQRQKNITRFVHYNKYLFNNSSESFRWLCDYDPEFLKYLVHYSSFEDAKLCDFVLHNSISINDGYQYFGTLFWHFQCDDELKIVFHNGMIEAVERASDKDKKIFLDKIEDYLVIMRKQSGVELAIEAELLGKLAYYAEKIAKPLNMNFRYFVRLVIQDEESPNSELDYEKEFKKRNYYNIPDFKQVWEDTRYGGTW